MSLSVIIPSRTISNLIPCVNAVRRYERGARLIIVDDGLEPKWCKAEESIPGIKPFVYARNCNLGIQAAGSDDVVLLNDDALLETHGGFSVMQQAAQKYPEFGLIAATCNNVGNRNQWRRGKGLREDPRMVCFVCVFIPRSTINTVGLLDEQFIHYGSEDDDYCRRVRNAGLKIGIHDGCYVDHGSLWSTFRGHPAAGGAIAANKRLYLDKWGSLA